MNNNNSDIIICNDCNEDIEGTGWDFEGTYLPIYDIHVCYNCLDNYYYRCYHCGEYYLRYELILNNGDYYCEDCIPQYNYSILNEYGNSPEVELYGTHKDGRYYGVELECDGGYDIDELLYDLHYDYIGERAFFQQDGSLADGFELITHPLTLEYHMNSFPWDDINQMILDYDFRSHYTKTCGLHIHVSKKAFGDSWDERDLNIAKMVIIFERFWDEIVNFSRRDYSKINQWAKKPAYKFYKDDCIDDVIDKSKFSHRDRYSCINLNNRDTVEFRVFRGTLNPNTLIASIQLIDVLLDYVKSTTLDDIFEDDFLTMLGKNKYQELTKYLNERRMI